MYKNQLQELAQRSCFNLPSYACIREGPDHAPRFRASVNFNGEIFEGPSYCTTLRQAEHAAAEVALNNLSCRGPSRSLAARVLDETGVYKNLLQETAHRAGLKLPVYTTVRSGPGHQPVFICSVELAGMSFNGEPAKTKKQAEKNAAMAAWAALKQMPNLDSLSQQAKESESSEEQEQVVVARVLSNFKPKEESKTMRMREQQQQRRRMMLSNQNSFRHRHQWRSSDQQKQCSFLALPSPTSTKILPPLPLYQHSSSTSQEPPSSRDMNFSNPSLYPFSRPIAVHIRNRLEDISIQKTLPPVEEQKKDEGDWINGVSDVKEKQQTEKESYIAKPIPSFTSLPSYPPPYPLQSTSSPRIQHPQMTTHRPFNPPPHSHASIGGVAPLRSIPPMPIPRRFKAGGFHASGIAPAVNIRSVIPVCAAPPMRPPANTLAVMPKKEPEEEVSAATSKLSKLQL